MIAALAMTAVLPVKPAATMEEDYSSLVLIAAKVMVAARLVMDGRIAATTLLRVAEPAASNTAG